MRSTKNAAARRSEALRNRSMSEARREGDSESSSSGDEDAVLTAQRDTRRYFGAKLPPPTNAGSDAGAGTGAGAGAGSGASASRNKKPTMEELAKQKRDAAKAKAKQRDAERPRWQQPPELRSALKKPTGVSAQMLREQQAQIEQQHTESRIRRGQGSESSSSRPGSKAGSQPSSRRGSQEGDALAEPLLEGGARATPPQPDGSRFQQNQDGSAGSGAGEDSEASGPSENKLSFSQALFTSLNYNLGLAVLSYPFQVRKLGWSAYISLIIVCLVCWLTAWMLGRIMIENADINSYADIAAHAVDSMTKKAPFPADAQVADRHHPTNSGKSRASHMSSTALRAFQVTELFFYLVYNIVTVQEACKILFPMHTSNAVLWTVTLLMLFPAALVNDLTLLSRVSLLGIITFVLIAGVMLFTSIVELSTSHASDSVVPDFTNSSSNGSVWLHDHKPPGEWAFLPPDFMTWARAYGSILLLFAGHAVYPSIYQNLRHKSDYQPVVNWTFIINTSSLLVLSAVEVSAFGSLIVELPTGFLAAGTAISVFAQVLIVAKCVTGYPVIAHPIVTEVASRFAEEEAKNSIRGQTPMVRTPVLSERYASILDAHGRRRRRHRSSDAETGERSSDDETDYDAESEFEHERLAPLSYSPFFTPRLDLVQAREPNRLFADRIARVQRITEIVLLLLSVGAAIIVPSLAFCMCLVGSLFAVSLAVTLPGLFYGMVFAKGWRQWVGPVAISAFGVLSMVLSFSSLFSPS